jgi:hypothetical protein
MAALSKSAARTAYRVHGLEGLEEAPTATVLLFFRVVEFEGVETASSCGPAATRSSSDPPESA